MRESAAMINMISMRERSDMEVTRVDHVILLQ